MRLSNWLARRFKLTRDLEEEMEWLNKRYAESCVRWFKLQISEGKMTLADAEVLLQSVVQYHAILARNAMPDPVFIQIAPVFDKYDIKVDHPQWNHPSSL